MENVIHFPACYYCCQCEFCDLIVGRVEQIHSDDVKLRGSRMIVDLVLHG